MATDTPEQQPTKKLDKKILHVVRGFIDYFEEIDKKAEEEKKS
ncbi:MAG: hypothetical protein ACRCWY_12960 [Cellulosilyticaceae bacterium]